MDLESCDSRTASQLQRRVNEAALNVPLYADLWGKAGIDVARLRFPEDLARLPIVRKSDLLSRPARERLDQRFRNRSLYRDKTSGSTGQPLELLIDKGTRRRRNLRFLQALMASGYRPGQRLMLISSRPSDSIKKISPWAALTRWTYADLYLGTAAMLREYQRVRPHFLYGPMSPLLLLAQALAQFGGGYHRPLGVISTGEQLSPSNCRHLESVFGRDVTDFYGMTEVGLIASRSTGCSTYQIIRKGAFFFEYIPMPDLPGFERLVVTDLQGGSMPLIRYETGDLVRRDIVQPGKPIIEFAGKQVDFVWLPNGERVSPYLIDGAVGDLPGVTQYKVIQQVDRSMDVYIATQVKDVAGLWGQARSALGCVCQGLEIRMHALHELPATVSHKSRPIQTRVGSAG